MEEGIKEELEDPLSEDLSHIKEEEELELETGEGDTEDIEDMSDSTVDPLAYPEDCCFSCQYCGFQTPASNVLREHIQQRRDDLCPVSCSQCTFSCWELSVLREHLKSWHGEEPPSFSADSNPASVSHSSGRSSADRSYSCPHCDYTTRESFHLKKHIQTTHSNHCFYSCPHCEYSCVLIVSLKRHIRTCHSVDRSHSRPPGDDLTTAGSIDFGNQPFQYSGVHSSSLRRHNQGGHSTYRPPSSADPASVCQSSVQRARSLADRQEFYAQPGKRPFDEKLTGTCLSALPSATADKLAVRPELLKSERVQMSKTLLKEVTASSAPKKKYYRRNETASVASRRYPCDVCPARFTDRSNLKTHQRTHSKEKPYACDVCQASFTNRSNLTAHKMTHTKEKPYACDVCTTRFSRHHHLKTHKRIHTKEKPYACDVCQARFAQLSHLKRHQKSLHK